MASHLLRQAAYTAICLLQLTAANFLNAAEIPSALPEEVGMSSEGLQKINDIMQKHMDSGLIQGGITAVARYGKVVHFETHGLLDVNSQRPMEKDSLFIMASSTKPVLGVAAMMMIEQGLMKPEDPITKYLPEFSNMQVAVLKEPADQDISPVEVDTTNPPEHRLVPAHRDITIHDLLTHTSGLGSAGLGTATKKRTPRVRDRTLENQMRLYSSYALDFQPGERWAYSADIGLDVVARIIEIVSGQRFDEFLQERIFDPLDMNETYFNTSPELLDRRVVMKNREMSGYFYRPPTRYFSASGGLVSTAEDYLNFEQMLVNEGELFGHRLLKPESVRMMSSNQIGDLYRGFSRTDKGLGFGYTVYVTLDPAAANSSRSKGAFGWGGAFGTRTWTDPENEIAAVLFIQQPHPETQTDFESAIKQAILN